MIWTRTTAAGRMAGDAPTRRRFTVLLLIASLLASLGVVAPVSVTPALAVAGTIYVSDGDDCSGGTADISTGSFATDDDAVRAALHLAATDGTSGSVIHLCPGTYGFTSTVSITSGDDTLVRIEGDSTSDTTIERASGNSRFFLVSANPVDVVFADLTVTGARTAGSGGAILADSAAHSLAVERAVFEDNGFSTCTLTNYDGSHIAAAGDVSLSDATFVDGQACRHGGAVRAGGSISVNGGRFAYNWANGDGGALAAVGDVIVADAVFVGNEADKDLLLGGDGGAIWAGDDVTIVGGTLSENRAPRGGAVAATDDVDVDGAEFLENEATTIVPFNGGGAIRAGGTVATVDARFEANSSTIDGGAIWADSGAAIHSSEFTSNTALYNGGAIWTDENVSVTDGSLFSRNVANADGDSFGGSFTGAGGAIYVYGADITVRSSTFSDNAVREDDLLDLLKGASGGALRSEEFLGGGGTATVIASTFARNDAGDHGGAISTDNDLTVENSTFVENDAEDDGGAIWFCAGDLTCTSAARVKNATFVGNSAGSFGNIYWANDLYLQDTVFSGGSCRQPLRIWPFPPTREVITGGRPNARANSDCPGTSRSVSQLNLQPLADNGGPTETVELGSGSLAIDAANTPCLFATDQRGISRPKGARCDLGAFEAEATATVSLQASAGGVDITAGVPSIGPTTSVTVVATLTGLAPNDPTGGTVTFYVCWSETIRPTECSAENGETAGTSTPTGGVNAADGIATATLSGWTPSDGTGWYLFGATYSGNSAYGGSAAVNETEHGLVSVVRGAYILGTPSTTCENATFGTIQDAVLAASVSDTVVICDGAHALAQAVLVNKGDLTFLGESTAGTVVDGGDAVRLFDAAGQTQVSFEGLTLSNGLADGSSGGAVLGADVYFIGVDAISNTATGASLTGNGGAVFATGDVTIVDGRFEGNVADVGGGAVAADGTVTISGTTFVGNEATSGSGGAVVASLAVSVSEGTFVDNTAGGSGGAISSAQGVTLVGGTYTRNLAVAAGGAVDSGGALAVDGGIYTGNRANGDAGVFYTGNDGAITDGTFTGNRAGDEGGVLWGDADVTVDGGTYSENSAGTAGGALYVTSSLTLSGSVFEDNTAGTAGGAIWTGGGGSSIGGSFLRNEAGDKGGAVFAEGDFESSGGTYEENEAENDGGAIAVADPSLLVSRDDTFHANVSRNGYGGALYAASVAVAGSTLHENEGAGYGGAIGSYGTVDLTNATFVANFVADSGASYGGAVWAALGLTATYTTFVDNSTDSSSSYSAGDAISLDSGATVVLDHVLIVGSGAAGDCDIATSSVTDVGGSVETGTTCLGASPTGPDSTSGVPRVEVSLGTFADHGGPTWTYSLSDGSIAIDISDGPCTVATDQRGRTRPAGPGCDAGAYEAPFVVTPAYNGPWWINSSGAVANLSVAATISPPAAGCTLVFEFSGGIWTTSGATSETTSFTTSGTSRSDGTATAPLSNVRLGIYDVTVTVSGACSATEAATGTLAVLPGTVPKGAVGGGSYRLSDTGGWAKNSFGSIVSLSSSYNKRTGVTTTTTRGQIVWSSDADNSQGSSGWRLKDAFIRSTTDGSSIWQPFVCPNTVGSASPNSNPKCGRFTRTALLEERTVAGGWVPSGYGTSGLVTYTVTVYDGGSLTTCQRKQCRTTELADWFGLTIVGVAAPTSAADPVPQVGVPARIRIGSARVF